MDIKGVVTTPPMPLPPQEVKVVNAVNVSVVLTPKEIYDKLVAAGVGKTTMRLDKQIAAGVLAGLYIGFGFTTCMLVGGQVPNLAATYPGLQVFLYAGFGFPLGLTLILLGGADLFTGNCNYMVLAWIEGRCTVLHIARCLTISYFSNLCGCLWMGKMMVYADVFNGTKKNWPISAAQKKCSYTFGRCCAKAIMANWLVNLAVWLAISANDFNSKYLGVWLPISSFIALGLEHCIANQFLVPMAIMLGSGMTPAYFIRKNLVPATIGNFIGGAGFVGVIHSFVLSDSFDSLYGLFTGAWNRINGKKSEDGASSA